MKKYRVVSSTIPFLTNVEAEFDFTGNIVGDNVNIFGNVLEITQVGKIYSFTSKQVSISLIQLD